MNNANVSGTCITEIRIYLRNYSPDKPQAITVDKIAQAIAYCKGLPTIIKDFPKDEEGRERFKKRIYAQLNSIFIGLSEKGIVRTFIEELQEMLISILEKGRNGEQLEYKIMEDFFRKWQTEEVQERWTALEKFSKIEIPWPGNWEKLEKLL